jgi:hypothetical protein
VSIAGHAGATGDVDLTHAVLTTLPLTISVRDDGGVVDLPGDRLVIPVAGWWDVVLNVRFRGSAAGHRLVSVVDLPTGSTIWTAVVAGVNAIQQVNLAALVYLDEGAVLQAQALQTSGGTLGARVNNLVAGLRP